MSEYETCEYCGKRCYSKQEANGALNATRHHQYTRKTKKPCRAYFCTHCNKYHLTSQKYTRNTLREKYKNNYVK